jgi:hypothetical protein
MRKTLLLSALACLLLNSPMPASTADIDVYPGQSIQAALNAAQNGDTIIVHPGTYTENIFFKGRPITLRSAEGPTETIVNGGGNGPVVTFHLGEQNDSRIEGFTLKNGAGVKLDGLDYGFGGGILCRGSSPTITDNIIEGNLADPASTGLFGLGGGICLVDASFPLIEGNTIRDNTAESGGGIYMYTINDPEVTYTTYATIKNNTLINNAAQLGGAIFICGNSHPVMITNNTLEGNTQVLGDEIYICPNSTYDTECSADNDCEEGLACIEGICELEPDNPPVVGDGPFLAAGSWPRMPTTPESAFMLDVDYDVLWTFSDDFASCSEDCTHMAEYQALGSSEWTALAVTANAAAGTARVTLPVSSIQNATTYAFRFAVTDCASQTTESADTYYFRVATSDAPPVIIDGPFLAAGPWPVFPISASQAFVLDQNYGVYWTFSDDYASCSGLCTHLFRYRKVGDTAWSTLPVSTDAEGTSYAYVTLPVTSLESGAYEFRMNVRDCAGQWGNSGPKFFKFKVEPPM